jgi:glycine/betaine/sarcosine/D-proline reductase family selenoprotein B
MAKELEREGFPTVTVTALTDVARKVGANRVLRGGRFSAPCGNPTLPDADERAWRLALVRDAVRALTVPVDAPTVFEVTAGG